MTKKKYFSGLNYTLGNEDTTLELEMVLKLNPKVVFSVCGSGGRSLPLTGHSVADLYLSDLSIEQLMLAELRIETYKNLSYEDFLKFWGYYPYQNESLNSFRENIFKSLTLSDKCRDYFFSVFTDIQFNSLLYLGKWERTFETLSKINRFILGDNFEPLFNARSLDEQQNYYEKYFSKLKFKFVLMILGNKALFNALLYKGHFVKKNVTETYLEYYSRAFNHLFTKVFLKESFFAHLCFYGKINSIEGNPIEAKESTFNLIKKSKSNLHYINEDLVTYLGSGKSKFDFLSLSDVPSYFSGEIEKNYMQLIKKSLSPGAIIVIRYYLRVSDCLLDGYLDITESYSDLIEKEKVQMYKVKVYKFIS